MLPIPFRAGKSGRFPLKKPTLSTGSAGEPVTETHLRFGGPMPLCSAFSRLWERVPQALVVRASAQTAMRLFHQAIHIPGIDGNR